jgi:hypothetical protein
MVGVTLVFAEAICSRYRMCNPAAKRSGAKSGSEFREAKVKCTQSHPLLSFYLVNASQFPFSTVMITLLLAQELALID